MRVHADGGGIDDCVERFGAESESRHNFAADGSSKFTSLRFATRANRDRGTGPSKSERSGARGTSRTKNEYTALGEMQFLLKGAKHADIVGVRTGQRTVGTDDDCINGADVGREIVAVFEVLEDFLLVRNRDAETSNPEVRDGLEKIGQVVNEERQIHRIHVLSGERGIME